MIRLAGLRPEQDIEIVFTGLRPGEKLYEELLSDQEETLPTKHQKIRVAKVREYDYAALALQIEDLNRIAFSADMLNTVERMKRIIPEFISRNSIFETLDKERNSG